MRTPWILLAAPVLLGLVVSVSRAADKEVTLKGELTCGKCELKQAKKCTTVLIVKEAGKEVVYWLDDKGAQESYHEPVCGGGRQAGSVTGTVMDKDGKKWLTPTKVVYAK